MVEFGNKLRQLRLQAGMTQADLAKRLNLTKAVVSYYENHERAPSPDVLIKLATIFHVSTDYLLGITSKKMLDVSDLTEDEMALLRVIIETLRKNKR